MITFKSRSQNNSHRIGESVFGKYGSGKGNLSTIFFIVIPQDDGLSAYAEKNSYGATRWLVGLADYWVCKNSS